MQTMGYATSGYMTIGNSSREKCECHECTQARWKMSFQGQLQGISGHVQSYEEAQKAALQQQLAGAVGKAQV